MRDLYARAHVFVLPTLGEGWGLPIHEAMAMGLPVITTNHSGPAALVGDKGILLPSHEEKGFTKDGYVRGPTPAEIANAINYIKDHPEEARSLGQAARNRVATLFSPQAVANVALHHLEHDFLSPASSSSSSSSSQDKDKTKNHAEDSS